MPNYGPITGDVTVTTSLSGTMLMGMKFAGALTITATPTSVMKMGMKFAGAVTITATPSGVMKRGDKLLGGTTVTTTISSTTTYSASPLTALETAQNFVFYPGSTISVNSLRCPYGCRLAMLTVPATWTNANITLQSSSDAGATFQDIYIDGGEFTCTVGSPTASGMVILFDAHTPIVGVLKVRSGTAGSTVAQLNVNKALHAHFEPINL